MESLSPASVSSMSSTGTNSTVATVQPSPRSRCHCPPCLSRAEAHLNVAVKTVGTLGLVFSLTEVFAKFSIKASE